MRLLLFIGILLLTGCKAIKEAREERKERKVVEWNLLNPEKSARWCADHYPCTGDSVFVKEVVFDTLYTEGVIIDTLITVDTVTKLVRVQCPPVKTITKTEKETVYVSVIDSAASSSARHQVARLQKELMVMTSERDEWKVKAKSRMWMFIAACALILGLIAVIVAILKGKKATNSADSIYSNLKGN